MKVKHPINLELINVRGESAIRVKEAMILGKETLETKRALVHLMIRSVLTDGARTWTYEQVAEIFL